MVQFNSQRLLSPIPPLTILAKLPRLGWKQSPNWFQAMRKRQLSKFNIKTHGQNKQRQDATVLEITHKLFFCSKAGRRLKRSAKQNPHKIRICPSPLFSSWERQNFFISQVQLLPILRAFGFYRSVPPAFNLDLLKLLRFVQILPQNYSCTDLTLPFQHQEHEPIKIAQRLVFLQHPQAQAFLFTSLGLSDGNPKGRDSKSTST